MNRLKLALPYITIILFVASLGLFVFNHGFKYDDYENYIRVQVNGTENVDSFVERLSETNGLIELDKANNFAYYQQVDKSVVEESINNVKKDYPEIETTVETIYPSVSKKQRVIDLALTTTLIILLFAAFSYVTKTRAFNWNLREYGKYYGLYFADNILSLGILAGLVSLLSLVYKINDYVLFSFFVLVIVKTSIYWFKLLQEDINQMKTHFVENFVNDSRKIFVAALILCVLLAVGMGVRSVIPLAFILVAITVNFLTNYSILTFQVPRFRRAIEHQVENKEKTQAKPEKTEKKYVPNPKLKKKNKKKK